MILRRVAPLGRRRRQQQQQQRLRAAGAGGASPATTLLPLLLLLAAGGARAYMLLPGGSRLPHSAKAWGSFRQRLGLGPRTAAPVTGLDVGSSSSGSKGPQQGRLVPPLRSATAPSPPKAGPEGKKTPTPAPAELLMDELGDLELQVATKIEVGGGIAFGLTVLT
jgi:hypothetical protein